MYLNSKSQRQGLEFIVKLILDGVQMSGKGKHHAMVVLRL